MIVTCENCNTGFNLDENLIKEAGSKVKCSKCRHIFTVHKIVPAEEEVALEAVELEEELAAEEPAAVEEEVALEETPEAIEEAPEEPAMVSDEALEEALDLDLTEAEEKPAEEEVALEAVELEEEPAAEEPAAVEEEVALEEAPEAIEEAPEEAAMVSEEAPEEALDLDLSEAEEKPAEEEVAPEAVGLEEELAAEEPTTVEEEIALEEAPEAVEGEPVIEEAEAKTEFEDLADAVSVESLEGAEEEETEQVERLGQVEEELMAPPLVAETVPQARRRLSTPLMIVLALVLLAGGAFAAYSLLKSSDIKIPFLESLTGGPESGIIDPGNLRIALLDKLIRSDFIDNRPAGRLFVIKGKVRNDYPEARNFIMVKGALYSKDGKTVDKKTIYCGNTLSGTDLQALDKATMDRRLRKRSSFSVPSGKEIPFVVVFSDLPQDLGEFSVEVVSSAPG
jgi:predicted Zn finger-like uncharacterized protein